GSQGACGCGDRDATRVPGSTRFLSDRSRRIAVQEYAHRRLELQEAMGRGESDQIARRVRAELAQDACPVGLDRSGADGELRSRFRRAQTANDQSEDLSFASGQRRQWRAGRAVSNAAREQSRRVRGKVRWNMPATVPL